MQLLTMRVEAAALGANKMLKFMQQQCQ